MVKAIMKKVMVCVLTAAVVLSAAQPAAAEPASPVSSVDTVTKNNVAAKAVNGVTPTVNTKKNGTASIQKLAKTNKTSITISSKVTVNGVKYTVTTISAKAFANCAKAKKISLPSTVKTISKNAFSGAKKLKTITLQGTKAITVKKGAFNGLNTKKMTIKVSKKMSAKELKKLKKTLKKAGFKGKVKKA